MFYLELFNISQAGHMLDEEPIRLLENKTTWNISWKILLQPYVDFKGTIDWFNFQYPLIW